jgi:hypothetical protein
METLTEAHCIELQRSGFFVVDSFFGEPRASVLRDELATLREAGMFSPNKTSFGRQSFTKPGVLEADLHDTRLKVLFASELRSFAQWFADCSFDNGRFSKTLMQCLPELALGVADSCAIKLQVNEGGAFPWHFDNPGPPCRRQVTLVSQS